MAVELAQEIKTTCVFPKRGFCSSTCPLATLEVQRQGLLTEANIALRRVGSDFTKPNSLIREAEELERQRMSRAWRRECKPQNP